MAAQLRCGNERKKEWRSSRRVSDERKIRRQAERKGDLIGSDSLTKEQVIKTNANVKALTYCDLQYISLKGLREVLRLYPEYAQKFISEIQHDLTYNLREGHGADVDWESNGGLVKKLPSIREDEEGDEDQSSVSRPARSPLRLSRALNSPLRSPLLPPRPFRAPSDLNRPATLQIPVVSFCSAAPPEVSPRFVDGIETDTNSLCSQKFEFSPSMSPAVSPSPYTGNRQPSEIKQSVSKLAEEMNSLTKQVSLLSQELQEMTRLLKPLLQQSPPPILMTMMPNLTPPPSSSASQLSTSTCLVPPPLSSSSSPRPDSHSLLDGGDIEGVDLPGCLLPTPPSPKRLNLSPKLKRANPNPPSLEEGLPEGPLVLPEGPLVLPEGPLPLPPSPANGIYLPFLQDQPPSPSLSLSFSMSLCSSPSFSTCLLPPPPTQDTPPPRPAYSHCSAPPSLTSSPGDHSTVSASRPMSLDFVRRKQGDIIPPWCNSQLTKPPPQELEMQEMWGRQVGEEGRNSTEHISFIDEEEPALLTVKTD
ncbi:potassium voltage-gated channel subfamily H member 8-like [Gymnodraco acuticeps]|uniref:Potassium voltage-gated channel subfamily H member 8-like n=1 Tax=Gymnodraco acuticeps TaxID=8218 RepID=A0A6P8SR33_GYMAC|nr:potassium voltage-gated channel subfamily H member 8-like [Gymnodraco acuticeps]